MRRLIRTLAKRAGISGTPYDFRHTVGSLASDQGVPLEVIADQLGHQDTRTLQRHYRHRVGRTQGLPADQMSTIIGGL